MPSKPALHRVGEIAVHSNHDGTCFLVHTETGLIFEDQIESEKLAIELANFVDANCDIAIFLRGTDMIGR